MVLLSSAIKGIPAEIIEAARIDGANEWQIFWRITVPFIGSTVAVVATTIIIFVLKVFDIVWVMTGGQLGTDVLGTLMIKQMFDFGDFGRGSAIGRHPAAASCAGDGGKYSSITSGVRGWEC